MTQPIAPRTRSAARLYRRVVLLLACALVSPVLSWAQPAGLPSVGAANSSPMPPSSWPQVVLLEGKGAGASEKDALSSGVEPLTPPEKFMFFIFRMTRCSEMAESGGANCKGELCPNFV